MGCVTEEKGEGTLPVPPNREIDLKVKASRYRPILPLLATSSTDTLARGPILSHLHRGSRFPTVGPASSPTDTVHGASGMVPSNLPKTSPLHSPPLAVITLRLEAEHPSLAKKPLCYLAPGDLQMSLPSSLPLPGPRCAPPCPLCCSLHAKPTPASGPLPLLISLPGKPFLSLHCPLESPSPHVAK